MQKILSFITIFSILLMPFHSVSAAGGTFSVSSTPSTTTVGAPTQFSITITNTSANNGDKMGTISIVVPATFTPISTLSTDLSTWNIATSSGNTIIASAKTNNDQLKNQSGQNTIIVRFTTTPSQAGTYNFSVSAGSGFTSTTSQPAITVNVVDATAPVITLTGSSTVTVEAGSVYADAGATALDNVDGDITSFIQTVNNVSTHSTGSHTITYNVSDNAGNSALEVTRTVNVVDTTAPVITLQGAENDSVWVGSEYTDPGATAFDVHDGDLSGLIIVSGLPINTSSPATFQVTYNVSDANGNAATEVTRTVTVIDVDQPIITMLGDATVYVEVGDSYIDAGVTAVDNVDGDITGSVIISGLPIDASVIGNHTITYNVSDNAGNSALEVTRTVNVVDTTAPVITLNGLDTLTVTVNSTYVDEGATVFDIGDNTIVIETDFGGLDTSVVGTYTITYTAKDSSNNEAISQTRTVIVEAEPITPNEAPTITLLGDNPFYMVVGQTYVEPGYSAHDTEDGDITNKVATSTTLVTSATGTYSMIYTVSDNDDASTSTSRTIIVEAAPVTPEPTPTQTQTQSSGGGSYIITRTTPSTTPDPIDYPFVLNEIIPEGELARLAQFDESILVLVPPASAGTETSTSSTSATSSPSLANNEQLASALAAVSESGFGSFKTIAWILFALAMIGGGIYFIRRRA